MKYIEFTYVFNAMKKWSILNQKSQGLNLTAYAYLEKRFLTFCAGDARKQIYPTVNKAGPLLRLPIKYDFNGYPTQSS